MGTIVIKSKQEIRENIDDSYEAGNKFLALSCINFFLGIILSISGIFLAGIFIFGFIMMTFGLLLFMVHIHERIEFRYWCIAFKFKKWDDNGRRTRK